jgi:sirohydrochlorin ferrochelatase
VTGSAGRMGVAATTPVVLLGHGSPDPRSAAAVRAAADRLSRGRPAAVTAAFLDHDQPRLADVDIEPGAAVLPLLLSTAYHAKVDVPAAVASLPIPVQLLAPLGHPADVLDAVILEPNAPSVIVVAAGTGDDDERAVFAAEVREAGERTGVIAQWAFATGPGPRIREVAAPGTPVVPWLLAPGRLLDAIHNQATARKARIAGRVLLEHPLMRSHLVSRIGG